MSKEEPECCCGDNYKYRDLCPEFHGVNFEETREYIFAPYITIETKNTDEFNEHVLPLIDKMYRK